MQGLIFAVLARMHGVTVARIQQIYQQVMNRGGKRYLTRNMVSQKELMLRGGQDGVVERITLNRLSM